MLYKKTTSFCDFLQSQRVDLDVYGGSVVCVVESPFEVMFVDVPHLGAVKYICLAHGAVRHEINYMELSALAPVWNTTLMLTDVEVAQPRTTVTFHLFDAHTAFARDGYLAEAGEFLGKIINPDLIRGVLGYARFPVTSAKVYTGHRCGTHTCGGAVSAALPAATLFEMRYASGDSYIVHYSGASERFSSVIFYFMEQPYSRDLIDCFSHVCVSSDKKEVTYDRDFCMLNTAVFFAQRFKKETYSVCFPTKARRIAYEDEDDDVTLEFHFSRNMRCVLCCIFVM